MIENALFSTFTNTKITVFRDDSEFNTNVSIGYKIIHYFPFAESKYCLVFHKKMNIKITTELDLRLPSARSTCVVLSNSLVVAVPRPISDWLGITWLFVHRPARLVSSGNPLKLA